MTLDQAITDLKLRQIPDQWLEKVKHGFKCIGCGNGSGTDGTGAVLSADGTRLLCGKCAKGFSYIDVAAYHYGIDLTDFVDGVKKLCEIEGISLDNHSAEKNKLVSAKIDDKMKNIIDNIIETSRRNLKNFVENQGGNWRGLSLELLQRLNWGFNPEFAHPKNPNKKFPAIIIPNDKGGLFARGVNSKEYSNISPTGTTTIFLPDSDNFDLIITEGAINGASILQAIPAPSFGIIASGGTSGNQHVVDKLQQLRNAGKNFRVIIAYDNDSNGAGDKAAVDALKRLIDASFTACRVNVSKTPDTDLNDALNASEGILKLSTMINDAFTFAQSEIAKIEHAENQNLLGDNSSAYFSHHFQNYVDENQKFSDRKTGFSNLDDQMKSFRPGIYVLGGLPALGKTSFALQLLEQMAQNGETSIYCSFEMEQGFLYSKLLAREVAKIESNDFAKKIEKPLTAVKISQGKIYEHTDAYTSAVNKFSKNPIPLFIWELDEIDVDKLLARLDKICAKLQKPPIICLDYLQILAGNSNNTKATLDDVLHKIFTFRRRTNATFIIVSSLNRMNYNTEISFEAFKETGNIEYSADVIWGLQLDLPKRDSSTIDAAKKEIPRKIQLKCLKNRFGYNFDIGFLYYPNCDTFTPNLEYHVITSSQTSRTFKNSNAD